MPSFQYAVRIALQHRAVHERAGIPSSALQITYFGCAVGPGDGVPLQAGGVAGPAAAAQPAAGDLLADFRGRPSG